MQEHNYPKIKTDEELMETVSHGSEMYPFRFYDEAMSMFDCHTIDWHWHSELEFVYVEAGEVTVWAGTDDFILHKGEGLFINSRELHRFYSKDDAIIPNFLFSPSFIAPEGSLIYQKYIEPVISSSLSGLVFNERFSGQADILKNMLNIISLQRIHPVDELATTAEVCALWSNISKNVSLPDTFSYSGHTEASRAKVLLMMQFIHDGYSGPLSLDDISAAASVSRSTALNLFRRYLQTTPVDYLISYRLKQAALLLHRTEKRIGVISSETGFVNVDYFCRTFKKHYGMTPTGYRALHNTSKVS